MTVTINSFCNKKARMSHYSPVETLLAVTCSSIRRGDLHGVRGNVGSVGPTVLAGAGEWYALLVAGELDELAEFLLSEHLQGGPEELNVLIGLHQTHLIHGVSLTEGQSRE